MMAGTLWENAGEVALSRIDFKNRFQRPD